MCPRPDAAAPLRLWCIPFAGGGAAAWHPWAAPLKGLAEVVAVRLPGRENRLSEPLFTRLDDIVAAVVEMLAPYAHETYALCGHSLGGLAVFELAKALRARGLGSPQAVVICGVRAPHYTPDQPLIHPMERAAFIAEVERRYGAIPPEIRDAPEVMDLLLPVLRADLEVYETYRHAPAPPLTVPMLALGGTEDTNVPRNALFDWRDYTSGHFEADLIPGGHFFAQENLAPTVARVREFLQRMVVS